jgi:hypothetical protein
MPVGTEIVSAERVRCDTGPISVATVDLPSCLAHGIWKDLVASFQAVEGLKAPTPDLICISGTDDRKNFECSMLPHSKIFSRMLPVSGRNTQPDRKIVGRCSKGCTIHPMTS